MRKLILAALSVSLLCFAAQAQASNPKAMRSKCFSSHFKSAMSTADCGTIRRVMNDLGRHARQRNSCQARTQKQYALVKRRYTKLCSLPNRCLKLVRAYYARGLRARTCAQVKSAMTKLRRLARSGPRRCRALAKRRYTQLRNTKYRRLCLRRPHGPGGKRPNLR